MFFRKKPRAPKPEAIEITETNFKELVLDAEVPVLLDFWAAWCMPCKILGPIIDELSGEYEGKAVIGKVNTETARSLASQFQIRSIPTVMLFHKGKLKERYAGVVPKPNLEELLNAYVDENVATQRSN